MIDLEWCGWRLWPFKEYDAILKDRYAFIKYIKALCRVKGCDVVKIQFSTRSLYFGGEVDFGVYMPLNVPNADFENPMRLHETNKELMDYITNEYKGSRVSRFPDIEPEEIEAALRFIDNLNAYLYKEEALLSIYIYVKKDCV